MREHDELILAYIDERLDAAFVARFQQLFLTDDAFVARFAALSILNSHLTEGRLLQRPLPLSPSSADAAPVRTASGGSAVRTLGPTSPTPFRFPRTAYTLPATAAALLIAAAVVAIYVFAFNSLPKAGEAQPETRNSKPAAPIATVLDTSDDATLTVNDNVAAPGSEVRPGSYTLDKGTADFRLGNGVNVTLRGSTQLTVHDPLHATLARGSASFDCPHTTRGYTVYLPGGTRVVDLGTVFTVDTNEQGAGEVRVDEGRVRVEWGAGAAARSMLVDQGRYVWVNRDGAPAWPKPRPIEHVDADADPADGWYALKLGGELTALRDGPALDYCRIGWGGKSGEAVENVAYVFKLPHMDDPKRIVDPELRFDLIEVVRPAGIGFGVDVYGLDLGGRTALGVDDIYAGPDDPRHPRVAQNVLRADARPGVVTVRGAAMADYLRSLYKPDGTPRVAYVVFRLNPNADAPGGVPYAGFRAALSENTGPRITPPKLILTRTIEESENQKERNR